MIDVKWATSLLGVATNTAATLIADMVSFGVLMEITGQRRNRLFVFRDYLELFRSPS